METLRNLAEISITVAGFSALITLFQNKSKGLVRADMLNLNRLYIMVEVSLLTCMFCYLPVLLSGYTSGNDAFVISSLVLALILTAYGVYVIRRNKTITGVANPGGKATILMRVYAGILTLGSYLNAFDLLGLRHESNYLTIILLMIAGNFYFFLRVIYSSISIDRDS